MDELRQDEAKARIQQVESRLAALQDKGLDPGALRVQVAFAQELLAERRFADVESVCAECLELAARLARGQESADAVAAATGATRDRYHERQRFTARVRSVLRDGVLQDALREQGGATSRPDYDRLAAGVAEAVGRILAEQLRAGQGTHLTKSFTRRINAAVSGQMQDLRKEFHQEVAGLVDGLETQVKAAFAAAPAPQMGGQVLAGTLQAVEEDLHNRLRKSLLRRLDTAEKHLDERLSGLQSRLDVLGRLERTLDRLDALGGVAPRPMAGSIAEALAGKTIPPVSEASASGSLPAIFDPALLPGEDLEAAEREIERLVGDTDTEVVAPPAPLAPSPATDTGEVDGRTTGADSVPAVAAVASTDAVERAMSDLQDLMQDLAAPIEAPARRETDIETDAAPGTGRPAVAIEEEVAMGEVEQIEDADPFAALEAASLGASRVAPEVPSPSGVEIPAASTIHSGHTPAPANIKNWLVCHVKVGFLRLFSPERPAGGEHAPFYSIKWGHGQKGK